MWKQSARHGLKRYYFRNMNECLCSYNVLPQVFWLSFDHLFQCSKGPRQQGSLLWSLEGKHSSQYFSKQGQKAFKQQQWNLDALFSSKKIGLEDPKNRHNMLRKYQRPKDVSMTEIKHSPSLLTQHVFLLTILIDQPKKVKT